VHGREPCTRIRWQPRGSRRVGDPLPIRTVEAHLTVFLEHHAETFLVQRTMMAATDVNAIVGSGGTAIGPVPDMVDVAVAESATGKAAAAVPVLERSPDRRRHGPAPPAHIAYGSVRVVRHDHAARITGQAPGHFRGNSCIGQHRLSRVGCFAERGSVHMHDHFRTTLQRTARIGAR
jgi:hypothetical protein